MRLDHEKVRWRRDRRGWTLDTLGEEAGVAKGTVLRAEHGEDVRPSSGRRIAHALGVELSDLIPDKPGRVGELVGAGKAEAPGEAGPAVVAVGVTPEVAAEKLEQQLYSPARIAQDWRRLAQRWEKRLEKGDFDARSLEDFVDTLEDVALSMQASVAAERRELRARYGEDVAHNRAVLRPALDRLSTLIGEVLRKIDAKELEDEAELAGKLARLEGHLKRAS